jgi:UDP-N-acetylglucosamine 2-epimerase
MAEAVNPYGDGKAAERIVEVIDRFFGSEVAAPGDGMASANGRMALK